MSPGNQGVFQLLKEVTFWRILTFYSSLYISKIKRLTSPYPIHHVKVFNLVSAPNNGHGPAAESAQKPGNYLDGCETLSYTRSTMKVYLTLLVIIVDWNQMRNEYEHSKKVAGYVEASIYEVALTLCHFERMVGKCNSKQTTQNAIDKYILERGKEVIRSTVNKDIRNLRAFINWCRENRYVNGEIKIRELKEDERPVKSLSNTQIKKLLSTAKPYKTLWMRILLALGKGLRSRDIESWMVSDIDFENSDVTTRSQKTRKSMGSRPVPVPIMAELKEYVS